MYCRRPTPSPRPPPRTQPPSRGWRSWRLPTPAWRRMSRPFRVNLRGPTCSSSSRRCVCGAEAAVGEGSGRYLETGRPPCPTTGKVHQERGQMGFVMPPPTYLSTHVCSAGHGGNAPPGQGQLLRHRSIAPSYHCNREIPTIEHCCFALCLVLVTQIPGSNNAPSAGVAGSGSPCPMDRAGGRCSLLPDPRVWKCSPNDSDEGRDRVVRRRAPM